MSLSDPSRAGALGNANVVHANMELSLDATNNLELSAGSLSLSLQIGGRQDPSMYIDSDNESDDEDLLGTICSRAEELPYGPYEDATAQTAHSAQLDGYLANAPFVVSFTNDSSADTSDIIQQQEDVPACTPRPSAVPTKPPAGKKQDLAQNIYQAVALVAGDLLGVATRESAAAGPRLMNAPYAVRPAASGFSTAMPCTLPVQKALSARTAATTSAECIGSIFLNFMGLPQFPQDSNAPAALRSAPVGNTPLSPVVNLPRQHTPVPFVTPAPPQQQQDQPAPFTQTVKFMPPVDTPPERTVVPPCEPVLNDCEPVLPLLP